MKRFNFANAYKEVAFTSEAIENLDTFLGRNFSSPDRTVVQRCAQLYRDIIYEINQLSGGYYSSMNYLSKYKYKVDLDSGCYFVVSIVCDSSYRKVLFVIENFFFPISMNGIYSILSETKNKIIIKESQLRKIIRESIIKYLNVS